MYSKDMLALMDATTDAVMIIDHLGHMTALNEATRRAFGYGDDELTGRSIRMLMADEEFFDAGSAGAIDTPREISARRRDGSVFPARLSVARIPGTGHPRFVAVLRDVTAEHRTSAELQLQRDRADAHQRREEEAARSQERITRVARLASMGELAAGMAHELNQPLTAIASYARACDHYLASATPDLAEIREAVREISAEGLRAGRIIDRLRRLVRNDEQQCHERVNLNAALDDLRTLLGADARAFDARLEVALDPDLPDVSGDAIQLQQVVLNLVRNAFEAMSDTPAGERLVRLTTARTDARDIEIRVSDTGPGIPSAIADRLFHPFATTKANGTGLGLAISRTLVHAHGGTIAAESLAPHGTCLVVKLPAAEDALK